MKPLTPIPMIEPMTLREKEVVELIMEGKCNKLIVRSLSITERTVKAHVSSILRKMGLDSRYQVVAVINALRSLINDYRRA